MSKSIQTLNSTSKIYVLNVYHHQLFLDFTGALSYPFQLPDATLKHFPPIFMACILIEFIAFIFTSHVGKN